MSGTTGEGKLEEARIMPGLLDSAERNGRQSPRHSDLAEIASLCTQPPHHD